MNDRPRFRPWPDAPADARFGIGLQPEFKNLSDRTLRTLVLLAAQSRLATRRNGQHTLKHIGIELVTGLSQFLDGRHPALLITRYASCPTGVDAESKLLVLTSDDDWVKLLKVGTRGALDAGLVRPWNLTLICYSLPATFIAEEQCQPVRLSVGFFVLLNGTPYGAHWKVDYKISTN